MGEPNEGVARFDLELRVTEFATQVVKFAQTIKPTTVTRPLISQFVRSGTSIGANYCEATTLAGSKRTPFDFFESLAFKTPATRLV